MQSLDAMSSLAAVLGSTTRLSILLAVAERPRNVGELCTALGLSQSLVSHHLADMRSHRLVKFIRRKQSKEYSLGACASVTCGSQKTTIVLRTADDEIVLSSVLAASEPVTPQVRLRRSSSPSL